MNEQPTERDALIALNRVQGIGAITVKRIIDTLGSAAAVFRTTETQCRAIPGVGAERAALLLEAVHAVDVRAETEKADACGVTILTWNDAAYPALLKQIADPPFVLYIAGDVAVLDTPAVAIVGTRHPTVYGRETARRFAYQLANAGYTIVSGLAEGIDTEAHTGAVKAKGKTVAVLGGALDCLYPKSNTGLAREIVAGGGAVISEYAFGRQPDVQTFPMRNRIVSGLCKGVLVVESPLKSGTLITAGQAAEQNRSVMVVPGRVDSPASQGSHQLIKEGARLVAQVDDVIEELQDLFAAGPQRSEHGTAATGTEPSARAAVQPARPAAAVLSADERAVLQQIDHAGVHVDAVIRATTLAPGAVHAILVGLQLKKQIQMLPGGMLVRL